MPGESPLDMMRSERMGMRKPLPATAPRRRLWPILLPVVVILLGLGWCWLWYYAASVADHTLSGWEAREAAAGRSYSCGSQGISGFPFRIEARCTEAAAEITSNQPPFTVSARDVTFAAQVYRPTLLIGDITGPLTIAALGQPPSFVANWSRAELSVRGLPPEPDSFAVTLDHPRLDQIADGGHSQTVFQADDTELDSRIVEGSARSNPVIDASLRFTSAIAPTLHPLAADPLQGNVEIVLRGLKNLEPKRWSERFREMQVANGNIEIKSLRVDRPDATIVGTGTLTINEHGRLDGLIRVAVVGVDNIVPLLGIDKLIGQGIDRLTGSPNPSSGGGLGALDRLVPGLSDVVRQNANASLIDNIKRMGQSTEIDKKPAILLPLRVADGAIYLGMIPLGQVPALF